ncbi:DNA repair protein Rev1 [Penicillium capsulatum]|uniref:DNA repair protein REV1 n=1 Tax=Penicillium capsulatum TaxID=69766 RepID=A0A9W9LZW6_9EURO|nr:DNA repair protein Rev1 [Penicillium capsulatum]
MRNTSVNNPDFLQQYYRESRLHHLSTWKAELKAQLQSAAREKTNSRIVQKKSPPGTRRYILHVDFDSFFAAVSILKHPELREKPVAIAHGPGSGSEIASCNYAARARGVKNGMWMKGALQSCPDLQVLPYDFPAYEDASRKFYSSVLSIDGVVQSVSIDEALVDITGLCVEAGGSDGRGISEGSIYREQAKADEIAQGLRDSVKDKTNCDVSVGIGGNILQAKVALRKAKPAGQFQLKPDAVLDFIGGLDVRDLPGVGYSLSAKLEDLGIKFVKDIRELTRERLISSLGPKTGLRIWDYSRGIDRKEVGAEDIRKSVSAEVNWGIRFTNQEQAEDFVRSLCEELNRRLVENLVKGKQLTLKVMRRSMDAPLEPVKHLGHGKCDVFSKSAVIGVPTNAVDILAKEAVSMLRSFNFSPGDLRGLGVQMTKLEPLKPGPSASLESSQRQISFGKSTVRNAVPDASTSMPRTPMQARKVQKILDTPGSQFIMPTQVDSSVLSELPEDIRSRLVAQAKPSPTPRRDPEPSAAELPHQSQLDPEILAVLPDDIRQEILGHYNQQSTPPVPPEIPVDPVARPAQPSALALSRPTSPAKRRRGRPPKSSCASNKSLKQSSFALPRPTTAPAPAPISADQAEVTWHQSDAGGALPEVSSEFLAALPEDIRQEILEEQQRARSLQQAQASAPTISRSVSEPHENPAPDGATADEKKLQLPPLRARPVFTSHGLSEVSDLRNAVGEWHAAFASQGPFKEDVQVLCDYLHLVIIEEHDIDKAVSVARWLVWLVGEKDPQSDTHGDFEPPSGQEDVTSWTEAIDTIHGNIQDALASRGLAPADLD